MNINRLPLNLDDLLRHRTVEIDRIEYKAGWNPDPIVRTLCAFANDFENLDGGYIVIGQDCDKATGQPVFPPVGVPDDQLDKIQKELLQYCHLIQPSYFPHLSVETFEGKKLVVLWAPGGQNRPYKAPEAVTSKEKKPHYYIRRFNSTIVAKGADEQELLRLTAKVPFDDRMCHKADLENLRLPLIQTFLKEVNSSLYANSGAMSLAELGRQLEIVDGGDEYVKPRNVGIMFFHESPEKFFPGTQIEVVIFPKGAAGGEIIEKVFKGPLHQQIQDALRYVQNNVIKEMVTKVPGQAEAKRVVNYPYAAIEEALVNTVYHRSYEQREPVEMRVNPEIIEIVSYPGPDPSIRIESLDGEKIVARRYRNRRIGGFLKELKLTEGRCTGIPTIRKAMADNGSPSAKFSTDDQRTYFLVELPVHPAFEKAHEEAHEKAHGLYPVVNQTEQRVLEALSVEAKNRPQIAKELSYPGRSGNLLRAITRLRLFELVELTIPEKPKSRNQKLRLTAKGAGLLRLLSRKKK